MSAALLTGPFTVVQPDPELAAAPAYSLGFSIEWGWDIAVGPDGSAYITGSTANDFQTTPGAADETLNGGSDAFVARVDATGRLVFATALGGVNSDDGTVIAVDETGATYVAGHTDMGSAFPTTRGAIADRYANEFRDSVGFLAKVSPDGSRVEWSTLLPGTRYVHDMALLSDGRIRVVGEAYPDFEPSPGAFDTEMTGGDVVSPASEQYVATVATDGRSWDQRSFVGGSGDDYFMYMAAGHDDSTYLTGRTSSSDLVTTEGALDRTYDGYADVFVMKISPDIGNVEWSTYLGGRGSNGAGEESNKIALGPDGSVYLTGRSDAYDFPTTPGAPTGTPGDGKVENWLARLDPAGGSLLYSGFVPAHLDDLMVGPEGDVYLSAFRATDDTYGAVTGQAPLALVLGPNGDTRDVVRLDLEPYAFDVDAAGTIYVMGFPAESAARGRVAPHALSPTAARGKATTYVTRQTRCTIRGTAGDDELIGTPGPDVICAGRGDDEVASAGGYDVVRLGDGSDIVDTGAGVDVVLGGEGGDRIIGGTRRDLLIGGRGNDVLRGGDGFDELRGGAGRDSCRGGSGRTQLRSCETR